MPKGGGREIVGKPYTIAGKVYTPRHNPAYVGEGLASWYGSAFHGRQTANGEVFDRESIAAAHPTLPLPSYARVTNLRNKRSMIVRINDRGPFHAGRVIDLSERAAQALDFHRAGTARVRVEYVGRASTRGSDDRKLLATLTTDGAPASFPGVSATQFAGVQPAQGAGSNVARVTSGALALAPVSTISVPALSPVGSAGGGATVASAGGDLPESIGGVADVDQPLDLLTIPRADVPSAFAVPPLPVARAQVAGLLYAPAEGPAARFARHAPFVGLRPAGFEAQ